MSQHFYMNSLVNWRHLVMLNSAEFSLVEQALGQPIEV